MEIRQNLQSVFQKKKSQLERLSNFIQKEVRSGKFYRYSANKRWALRRKLMRLSKNVTGLSWQIKLAAFGGTLAMSPLDKVAAQSNVGPFIPQTRANNPLRFPIAGDRQRPSTVDFDNDGDYDVVVGGYSGYVTLLLNQGGPTTPRFDHFELLNSYSNPIYNDGRPVLVDLDGDGDKDLVMGDSYSSDRIRYFISNQSQGGILGDDSNPLLFAEQFGTWNSVTKTGNPFDFPFTDPGGGKTVHFVNFDGDSDLDVLIGHNYSYFADNIQLHYYQNDGNNNFTVAPFVTSPDISGSDNYSLAPTFIDIDQDGITDLVVGNRIGEIRFFKGNGSSLNEQTGDWSPAAKTGNPFNTIIFGRFAHPAFADFDNDGDLDMIVGHQRVDTYKYSSNDVLAYFENKGNAVFEELTGFDNPFQGVDVGHSSAPLFVNFEEDSDIDIVLGSKYDYDNSDFDDFRSRLRFFKNNNGVFSEKTGSENPLGDLESLLNDFSDPVTEIHLVNLDSDADLEVMVDTYFDDFLFFDKSGGNYVQLTGSQNPFDTFDDVISNQTKATFGDLNGDGKPDMFLGARYSGSYVVKYYKNTTVGNTVGDITFEEQVGAENPFDGNTFAYLPLPLLVDVDSDGDLDVIIPERFFGYDASYNPYPIAVEFYENTGTSSQAEFTRRDIHPFQNLNLSPDPKLAFSDLDKDGDLDLFSGNQDGTIDYYLNQNPPPVATVSPEILSYEFGSGPATIDANLTLADSDNDQIVQATVAIQNFQPGNETLGFTPAAPITGTFDNTTGILTITGKASLAAYQSVLRTVTYEYDGPDPGGRKGNAGRVKAISRSVVLQTFDEDLTTPQTAVRTISVFSQGSAPVITASTLTTVINNSVTLDLSTIISDPDGNLDPLSYAVIPNVAPTPARVGNVSISNSILTVDYSGTNFAGTDFVTIEACDLTGLCSTEQIQIDVAGGIIVRNGISPNGDGLNDFFRLDNISTLGPENKVMIFNRWGDRVFEISNYNNDDRRFEGLSDDGKELSSGVYFYKIEFSNGLSELKGYLTLKR
ncbi:MAG: FG-GAP-like repeat-containing protein [Cyclobacteriaceae bacterium]